MTDENYSVRVAREADLPAVAQIHIASWRDAYKGTVPDALLLNRSEEGSLSGWQATFAKYPANITLGVSRDDVVCGFCCAGPVVDAEKNAPFEFQIYGLHVAPNHRQRGIGAILLRASFARAVSEGLSSAIVWTLRDLTLSRRFYEREGGEVVKADVWSIDGFTLPEVAYGWTNLHHRKC